MAASTEFFNPSDPFGLSGWECQSDDIRTSYQRAQALDRKGNECAHRTYGGQTSITIPYVITADNAVIPKVGLVAGSAEVGFWHIDKITVTFTNNDFVKMSIEAHKHEGGSSHAASSCRTYTGSLGAIASQFGCPATICGLTIPADAGVRSITYTLECNHVDEPGSQGDWLAGDNYDGKETVSVELCDTQALTAATGWDLMNKGSNPSNTGATASSGDAEHHLVDDATLAAASSQSSGT